MRIDQIARDMSERARALQTAEQMRDFLAEGELELTDEQLEGINGGTNFVQGFKTILGPYLYPPCPCGGSHEFEDYDDPTDETFDKVRCIKRGTVY
jgi:hypothetical protein